MSKMISSFNTILVVTLPEGSGGLVFLFSLVLSPSEVSGMPQGGRMFPFPKPNHRSQFLPFQGPPCFPPPPSPLFTHRPHTTFLKGQPPSGGFHPGPVFSPVLSSPQRSPHIMLFTFYLSATRFHIPVSERCPIFPPLLSLFFIWQTLTTS